MPERRYKSLEGRGMYGRLSLKRSLHTESLWKSDRDL